MPGKSTSKIKANADRDIPMSIAQGANSYQPSASSQSREKDSRQMAVGSKYGTTDYRTTDKEKILNRRAKIAKRA